MFAAFFASQANADCRISLKERAADLPTYVSNGQACLQHIPNGFSFDESMEIMFRDRINETRTAHGLAPLKFRKELRNAARWHSLDMAANNFFNHKGLDASMPKDRITALDRTLLTSLLLENIASINGDFDWDTVVDRLHTGLMNSPSHRDAILQKDVTHFAMGVVKTDNGVWLTELFVREDGSFERPVPLRIEAGSLVNQPARLKDWRFKALALQASDEPVDLPTVSDFTASVPSEILGKLTFTVRGERPGPRPNTRSYMHFHGPTVVVVPAHSS